VIILLIVIGGIGFLTWDDIYRNRHHISRYRMQSKVILSYSLALIFIPAILFFFLEFQDIPAGKRILVSLFQSVTTRTAGFNTADLSSMRESGQFLMILLMLVGGSPGSTAGGIRRPLWPF
jgi:trk system potassium uptake protein TrkH